MPNDGMIVAGQTIGVRSLVTEKLRLAIVTGRFRPGEQMSERELCALTGVSRPSLREALRQLEAEGLIGTVPHRGPVVAALTVEEARQVYTLRRVLETFAVGEFARLRRPDDIAALEAAVAELNRSETQPDPLHVLGVGTALYGVIATGSGNTYLREALRTTHNRITLIRFISLHHPARITRSFAKLRAMTDAIIAGDAELAQRICARHIDETAKMADAIIRSGYCLPAAGRPEMAARPQRRGRPIRRATIRS